MNDKPTNALLDTSPAAMKAMAAPAAPGWDKPAAKAPAAPQPKRAAPDAADSSTLRKSAGPTTNKQFQNANPRTAAKGVPVQTGKGERQLDGTRTATMSQPARKGLSERQPSPMPFRGSADTTSGLERAMAADADRHHPRTMRPPPAKRR